jgi:transcriptional regulator with XRE-family HTH domain
MLTHGAGIELRAARIGRRWTLRGLADRAGVAVASAHAAESGRPVSLETYARLAIALGQRPVLSFEARSRTGSNRLSRPGRDLVHAAMGEAEARQLGLHGYSLALDEPYQHFHFAGRADLLAWDLDAKALLHIENKSQLPDLQDLAGSYNAKRTYLPSVMAIRLGLGSGGWRTVTHALVVLWSSEVLHVLRMRRASFAALCPSPLEPFSTWWNGGSPEPGATSSLVIFDPAPDLSPRKPRFVGADRVPNIAPRYPGYAAAATALDRPGRTP